MRSGKATTYTSLRKARTGFPWRSWFCSLRTLKRDLQATNIATEQTEVGRKTVRVNKTASAPPGLVWCKPNSFLSSGVLESLGS